MANRSINIIEYESNHDRIICILMVFLLFSISGGIIISAIFIVIAIFSVRFIAKLEYPTPQWALIKGLPKHTYLIPFQALLDFVETTWPFKLLRLHKLINKIFGRSGMFVISLPYFNAVFFNEKYLRSNTYGFRDAELLHEFGHCNRYDALFLVTTTMLAAKLLRLPFVLHFTIDDYYQNNLAFFPILGLVLALLSIFTLSRVMHRREHVADVHAYSIAPDLYLRFIENWARNNTHSSERSGGKSLGPIPNIKTLWHPSPETRWKVITGQYDVANWRLMSGAIIWSISVTLMLRTLMLPRDVAVFYQPMGIRFDLFSFLGGALLIYVVVQISLSVMRCAHQLGVRSLIWVALGYWLGVCIAETSLFWAEDFFFADANYRIWDYLYIPLAFANWILFAFILATIWKRRALKEGIFSAILLMTFFISSPAGMSLAYWIIDQGSLSSLHTNDPRVPMATFITFGYMSIFIQTLNAVIFGLVSACIYLFMQLWRLFRF